MPAAVRRYAVRAAHEDHGHGRLVQGASFEEAAVAFIDAWRPQVDADGDISLIVRDLDGGLEHCFRIDLDSGAAEPCD